MARPLIVIAAFLSLAVSAAIAAPPADKGKPESPGKSAAAPGQQADKNASKKCKALRANNLSEFQRLYGTKPNAHGKCVSGTAKKQAEAEEETEAAKENASKKCKALRKNNLSEFQRLYGDKPNAHGTCVSTLAKAQTS
jgi:hypothetical protein